MATIAGALFDDYSTLNAEERADATALLGASVEFTHAFGPGNPLNGTSGNDVYFVDDSSTQIIDKGGEDIVVSSESFALGRGIENLILTGDEDINGIGNSSDNVIAGNNGDNSLVGGNGNDGLFGGQGADTLDAGNGNDTVYGGDGADSIDGGNDNDSLEGGEGNDTINAGNGNDTVYGNEGADSISAGNGNDSVDGGSGNDRIQGGNGNDTIYGDTGNDSLWGGNGNDQFVFGVGSGDDQIFDFEVGKDKLVINTAGMDTFADIFTDNFDSIVSETDGNTVVDLGNGNTITLEGVDIDDVHPNSFIIVQ